MVELKIFQNKKIKIKPPDLEHQHEHHFESTTQRIFHAPLMQHNVEVSFHTKNKKREREEREKIKIE